MARRRRKTRKLKQSIYIVAEGTNTERIYFEAIIEQIEEQAEKYSFQVKFVQTDKTDAIGLINKANELKSECDEIWAVLIKMVIHFTNKLLKKPHNIKFILLFLVSHLKIGYYYILNAIKPVLVKHNR
jgi:hypothetical protein